MDAFFSLHTIIDEIKPGHGYDILPQDNLIAFINQAIAMIPVEDCLPRLSFMLPKIREVRAGETESPTTLKSIVDLSLIFVNQAYKLKNLSDRFYVLLLALRKIV